MKAIARVNVRDRGLSSLIRDLTASHPTYAAVGILGEAAQSAHAGEEELDVPPTVLDVAIWNEFGLGVPERSFLRETIAKNQPAILERTKKEVRAIFDRKRTKAEALERIGMFVVGLVQERIASGDFEPNAPATIERKGSATPLIDTGQLRSSVTQEVR